MINFIDNTIKINFTKLKYQIMDYKNTMFIDNRLNYR